MPKIQDIRSNNKGMENNKKLERKSKRKHLQTREHQKVQISNIKVTCFLNKAVGGWVGRKTTKYAMHN